MRDRAMKHFFEMQKELWRENDFDMIINHGQSTEFDQRRGSDLWCGTRPISEEEEDEAAEVPSM